jgi:hypothetical protein
VSARRAGASGGGGVGLRADILATWNIVQEHLPPVAIEIETLVAEAERREHG